MMACLKGLSIPRIVRKPLIISLSLVVGLHVMFIYRKTIGVNHLGKKSKVSSEIRHRSPNHLNADEISLRLAMHRWSNLAKIVGKEKNAPKVEGTDELCSEWADDMIWKGSSQEPLIKLDPDKIVYPANQNGPSNELLAFQEAIMIGIETNRTVVVPQFQPHRYDKDGYYKTAIPASRRVDIKFLSKLVSLITTDQMRGICNSKFDVGFQRAPAPCAFHQFVERTSGMSLNSPHVELFGRRNFAHIKMVTTKYGEKRSKCDPPRYMPVRSIKKSKRSIQPHDIKNIYRSDLPCVILVNGYYVLAKNDDKVDQSIIEKAVKSIKSLTSMELVKTNADTKFKLIELMTRRPRYVREIAEEFIRDVMQDEEYIAMHWRYNFEFICSSKFTICDKLKTVELRNLSETFLFVSRKFSANKINNDVLLSTCQSPIIVKVYLATATSDYETIKDQTSDAKFQREFFRRILKKSERKDELKFYENQQCWKIEFFHKIDLFRFIDSKYPAQKCASIWRDTHELIALVENELCKRSEIFIYSPYSSWSEIAMQSRTGNIPIFDIFDEINEISSAV